MRLANKKGLVTAAGSGMGRAGVIRFAQEGASVAVVDIDQAAVDSTVAEIEAAGGTAFGIACDLRDDANARMIVKEAATRFGGLDFVWNHVGHPGPAAIEGIDMADYDIAMDLNLRTVLVTTEAALPELRASGGGALLFTASVSGLKGSPYSPVYAAAKFGVVGMVRSMAGRYAGDKIRVNAVCPGITDTPMGRVFVARPDQQSTQGADKEAILATLSASTPMGRAATPTDVANAALFLLSDEAEYISGAALPVDGGWIA
jgi:NAD(P)-dependent dehydrogenase (short-subunit alcohol dehydrogenase family)